MTWEEAKAQGLFSGTVEEVKARQTATQLEYETDTINDYLRDDSTLEESAEGAHYRTLVAKIGKIEEKKLADALKRLSYTDFLKTYYWKVVALRVKQLAGFACATCPSTTNLQAHHRLYARHGYEHKHLDDLVCLCRECHKKFHSIQ